MKYPKLEENIVAMKELLNWIEVYEKALRGERTEL